MNLKKCLLTLCWLFSPSAFAVGESQTPGDAGREEVSFVPSTEAAFDRSGNHVTHSFGADGVLRTEYHGTFGNVTVARVSADGRIEHMCTTDREAAIKFMSGGTTTQLKAVVELQLDER